MNELYNKGIIRKNKNNQWIISVGRCIHCNGLVIAPQNDKCTNCGHELYPTTNDAVIGETLKL